MKKILIVDDEQPTLDMCGLLLRALGYEVLTAENGSKGIDLFREKRPDIVLTDIKMPGKDGFEVIEQIMAINPHARVIVMTGHGDRDLAGKAMELGATDFVHKPMSREALERALQRAETNPEGDKPEQDTV